MAKGRVKWFNEQKGYGFITSEGKDYYVHHTGIVSEGSRGLPEGAEVQFDIEKSEKGPRAVKVVLS